MSSIKTRYCESCQRSLPEWWDEPWCPACPPGTNAYGQQEPDTDGAPPDPSTMWMVPPELPPEAGATPSAGTSTTTGEHGWAATVAGLLRHRLVVGLAVAAVALVATGIASVARETERQPDIASPAHNVLQAPCAEYRDLLRRAPDEDVGNDFIAWLARNQGAFAQAAGLDPAVEDAFRALRTLNIYFSDEAPVNPLSSAELNALDDPLTDTCMHGPGRS